MTVALSDSSSGAPATPRAAIDAGKHKSRSLTTPLRQSFSKPYYHDSPGDGVYSDREESDDELFGDIDELDPDGNFHEILDHGHAGIAEELQKSSGDFHEVLGESYTAFYNHDKSEKELPDDAAGFEKDGDAVGYLSGNQSLGPLKEDEQRNKDVFNLEEECFLDHYKDRRLDSIHDQKLHGDAHHRMLSEMSEGEYLHGKYNLEDFEEDRSINDEIRLNDQHLDKHHGLRYILKAPVVNQPLYSEEEDKAEEAPRLHPRAVESCCSVAVLPGDEDLKSCLTEATDDEAIPKLVFFFDSLGEFHAWCDAYSRSHALLSVDKNLGASQIVSDLDIKTCPKPYQTLKRGRSSSESEFLSFKRQRSMIEELQKDSKAWKAVAWRFLHTTSVASEEKERIMERVYEEEMAYIDAE